MRGRRLAARPRRELDGRRGSITADSHHRGRLAVTTADSRAPARDALPPSPARVVVIPCDEHRKTRQEELPMITRREVLALTAQAGAALALAPRLGAAQALGDLITRPMPSTVEELPIIGLVSSASFV